MTYEIRFKDKYGGGSLTTNKGKGVYKSNCFVIQGKGYEIIYAFPWTTVQSVKEVR